MMAFVATASGGVRAVGWQLFANPLGGAGKGFWFACPLGFTLYIGSSFHGSHQSYSIEGCEVEILHNLCHLTVYAAAHLPLCAMPRAHCQTDALVRGTTTLRVAFAAASSLLH